MFQKYINPSIPLIPQVFFICRVTSSRSHVFDLEITSRCWMDGVVRLVHVPHKCLI